MRFAIVFAGLALALASCTTVSRVGGGQRAVIENALEIQPTRNWSEVTTMSITGSAHVVVWTMDGAALNKLCFVVGLANGQSIHPDRNGQVPEPKFRSNMSATEVMELFEAAYSRPASTPIIFKAGALRPERFAGADGFRFEFTFVDQADEVERKGIAVGAIHKGRLYLVFYHGARIHFFGKNLAEVEAIIRSAKFL